MELPAPGDRLIGYCGRIVQEVDGQREVEIGYRLAADRWSRGLTTEAVRAVRADAFDRLALPRMVSLIQPVNAASIRVAEKNGMRRETVWRGRPTRIYAAARS